jgi:hypothetical protein
MYPYNLKPVHNTKDIKSSLCQSGSNKNCLGERVADEKTVLIKMPTSHRHRPSTNGGNREIMNAQALGLLIAVTKPCAASSKR